MKLRALTPEEKEKFPNMDYIMEFYPGRNQYFTESAIKELRGKIDELLPDNGWISVEDRLPKKQGHYLAYCPRSFPKNYRGVIAEFYEDNKMFYCEHSDSPIEDVTNWQSLPGEPIKKEQSSPNNHIGI